jgi:hypothetical protein
MSRRPTKFNCDISARWQLLNAIGEIRLIWRSAESRRQQKRNRYLGL